MCICIDIVFLIQSEPLKASDLSDMHSTLLLNHLAPGSIKAIPTAQQVVLMKVFEYVRISWGCGLWWPHRMHYYRVKYLRRLSQNTG